MEGLSGKAEELGLGYDKRPYVGAWLRKLDLDTQSDVSRRTAVIISIAKDSLHSLEDENEGLNPGTTVQTGGASVGGCFVHTDNPLQGSWKKCRSTSTVDTSLHIVPCQDSSALTPGIRGPPDTRSGAIAGWHTTNHMT